MLRASRTTPLHEAAAANDADAIRQLLAASADPRAAAAAKDAADRTPLMVAALDGNERAAQVLLRAAPETAQLPCYGKVHFLPLHAGEFTGHALGMHWGAG